MTVRVPPPPPQVVRSSLVRELQELLLDVWLQFSVEGRTLDNRVVKRYPGGLSVLEDVEYTLRSAGMIDANGMETRNG